MHLSQVYSQSTAYHNAKAGTGWYRPGYRCPEHSQPYWFPYQHSTVRIPTKISVDKVITVRNTSILRFPHQRNME